MKLDDLALNVASWLVGYAVAYWFAKRAERDAQTQHLAQLEQMRKHDAQELDLVRAQHQQVLVHLKTILHRLEIPGPVARDMHGVPSGPPLYEGVISSTLEDASATFQGTVTPPPTSAE